MKNTILIISVLTNIWFASAVIKLENFHYSVTVGMCDEKKFASKVDWVICNENQKMRTHDLWNLYYGLKNLPQYNND